MGHEDDWKAPYLLFGTHQGSFTSPAPVVFPGKISALLWNERTHQVALRSSNFFSFSWLSEHLASPLARWSETLTCLLLSPPPTWLADAPYVLVLFSISSVLFFSFLQWPGWLTCTCSSSWGWRIPFSKIHSASVTLEKQDQRAQLMMDPDQWFV